VIKTRPRKYDVDALYTIKDKQTDVYFDNGFLYMPTKNDKMYFLLFAKIIEGRIKLGILSVGASSIDRWLDHKAAHSFDGDLKKITYEKN